MLRDYERFWRRVLFKLRMASNLVHPSRPNNNSKTTGLLSEVHIFAVVVHLLHDVTADLTKSIHLTLPEVIMRIVDGMAPSWDHHFLNTITKQAVNSTSMSMTPRVTSRKIKSPVA